jgi:hypothetical protein
MVNYVAVGWLAYVVAVAVRLGVRYYDMLTYLVLPDLACTVTLSARTGLPVVRCEDADRLADFICYYNRRLRRYVCRAMPIIRERGEYEYQAVLSMIFKACYPEGERKERGKSILNNLHWECFKTYEFTTRDINEHVRYFGRGLRSIRGVLDFLNQISTKAEQCCHLDCLHSWRFENEWTILALSEVNYEYHSSERKEDTCYLDRCPEMFPGREEEIEEKYTEEPPFICEIEIKKPGER